MALKTGGGLETVSLVLTVDQAAALRSMKSIRESSHIRVSLSDIAREVVAAGLAVLLVGEDSEIIASQSKDEVAA